MEEERVKADKKYQEFKQNDFKLNKQLNDLQNDLEAAKSQLKEKV